MDSLVSQSSLEDMLESIKLRVKKPSDRPPALPTRPTSMARRPTSRFRALQANFSVPKEDLILQDRCYYLNMKNAAATLQSFIRGEISRSNLYVSLKKKRAALVIQKHVRQWIARASAGRQQREIAALSSEGSSRKVTFKTHRDTDENLPTLTKELDIQHPFMHISVAELQRRVIEAESALREKEEENALLRGKLHESEQIYLEYENNLKSMEQAWQKQLDSMQVGNHSASEQKLITQISISSSESSLPDNLTNYQRLLDSSPTICSYYDCDDGNTNGNRTPEKGLVKQSTDVGQISNRKGTTTSVGHLAKEFDQRMQIFEDDAGFLVQAKSGQLSSYGNPNEELRKLKARFTSWEKDYKSRLRETKATLKKLSSNSEEKRTWKSSYSNQREELRKLKARFTSWKKDYKSRLREAKAALKKLSSNSEEKSCFKKNSDDKRTWKFVWWKKN